MVTLYSEADEWAFFQFALHIPAVQKIEGEGDAMVIHVRPRPSEENLRDLIALFERYRISGMSQLAQFRTPSNERWFADARKFWHRKVFGKTLPVHGTSARSSG